VVNSADTGGISSICREEIELNSDRYRRKAGFLDRFLGLVGGSSFLLWGDINVSFSLVGDTKVFFGEEHSSVVNSANAGDRASNCREEEDEPNCR
jgi:hypothetical protein